MILEEGKKVQLKCSCSNCLPIKKFSWKRKDKKTLIHKYEKIDDYKNEKFSSILTISKAVEADEGSYECEIGNKIGTDRAKIDLLIQYPPKEIKVVVRGEKMRKIEHKLELLEFKDVAVECSGKGFPVPEISWFKNKTQVGKNILKLSKNKMNEHNGFYRCTIKNSLDEISKVIQVDVKIKPFFNGKKENSLEIKDNEKVTLNCDINGSPEPKISWLLNSEPLNLIKDFTLINEGKKLSFIAHEAKGGTYSCSGINEFGSASMSINANIRGKLT